jgi:aspartyl-tRNA(Asn)/glutamyl-tRNA(Gln) amidotransferase subunit A
VKRRIMLGTYALSADTTTPTTSRPGLINNEFADAFDRYDVIVTPTSPTVAFPIGAKVDDPTLYLNDVYTLPASVAGLPAISVPAASATASRGPQIIGNFFDEGRILQVAHAFEQARAARTSCPSSNRSATRTVRSWPQSQR